MAGTFAYTPPSGTVLNAGTQTLSVTFTPTDAVNYSPITKTVQIVVSQATPVIAWSNPASIVYGTALSTTQLNATASVPGVLVYTPAAGNIPAAGTDTLSVTFTPTDTTDYETATAHVAINVHAPPPVQPPPATPHVMGITLGNKSRKGLNSVAVAFDEPMNSGSVGNSASRASSATR